MVSFSNPELRLAYEFVESTGLNIFLTGKAGTGKTTFLKDLKERSPKRMVIVAPTGVAAINAGGVTIHSFFQLPFTPFVPSPTEVSQTNLSKSYLPGKDKRKYSREKLQIIKSIDLLVIDEISMVRADLLDAVDEVLRTFRDKEKPFGGVQLLMIGDLQQLAPVAREEEWKILRDYYDSVFFFSSTALKKTHFISVELKQIFRQKDMFFIEILNKVRENRIDTETLELLNERYIHGFNPGEEEGYIMLTTHNAKAREINQGKLDELPGKPVCFKAKIEGDFPGYAYPTDAELALKPGSQVMFVKNDTSPEKLYFNGKIGVIADIDEDVIYVECSGDETAIAVTPVAWSNIKYSLDEETKEIREDITGTFVQYPLKTAWAITIHKSQGLTFEKAIIDARSAFTHGQVYVALSRCRSLDGLILSTPLVATGLLSNPLVSEFISGIDKDLPKRKLLDKWKNAYQMELLNDLFNFKPLVKHLSQLLRLTKENKSSLLGEPFTAIETLHSAVLQEIDGVSERFIVQLKQLNNPENEIGSENILQERIIRGVNYFIEKTEAIIISNLPDIVFETDNKAVQKSLNEAYESLKEVVFRKLICLQSSRNGFNIKEFLTTRAKSAIEIPKFIKERMTSKKADDINIIKYPTLYNNIKAWRSQKSRELDLPAYMILQTKAMAGLATILPSNKSELLAVKGIGKSKVDKYGDEILFIISEFCRQNMVKQIPPEISPDKKKRQKGDSMEITLRMFNEGKTIHDIALERNMKQQTIEDHLAYFVGKGRLDIRTFVSFEKEEIIKKYFLSSKSRQLSPAREALGDAISYSELKIVLNHMIYKKMI